MISSQCPIMKNEKQKTPTKLLFKSLNAEQRSVNLTGRCELGCCLVWPCTMRRNPLCPLLVVGAHYLRRGLSTAGQCSVRKFSFAFELKSTHLVLVCSVVLSFKYRKLAILSSLSLAFCFLAKQSTTIAYTCLESERERKREGGMGGNVVGMFEVLVGGIALTEVEIVL